LRLSSDKDQQVIRDSTYEGMVDLIDFLPLLGDREAVVLGQATVMPMRIRVEDMGQAAVSKDASHGASRDHESGPMDRTALDEIVSRWRTTGRERTEF
jgi:hypothetical protein